MQECVLCVKPMDVLGRYLVMQFQARLADQSTILTYCYARLGEGGEQFNASVVGADGAGHRWLPHDVDPYGLAAAAARFSIAPPPPG